MTLTGRLDPASRRAGARTSARSASTSTASARGGRPVRDRAQEGGGGRGRRRRKRAQASRCPRARRAGARRSFCTERLTIGPSSGPNSEKNPPGAPRTRLRTIVEPPPSAASNEYVTAHRERRASRSACPSTRPGSSSVTSLTYSTRRPRKWATRATRLPTAERWRCLHPHLAHAADPHGVVRAGRSCRPRPRASARRIGTSAVMSMLTAAAPSASGRSPRTRRPGSGPGSRPSAAAASRAR